MRSFSIQLFVTLSCFAFTASAFAQQPLVPGTGQRVPDVGDNFEEQDWSFNFELPKSSKNINGFGGGTGGESQDQGPKQSRNSSAVSLSVDREVGTDIQHGEVGHGEVEKKGHGEVGTDIQQLYRSMESGWG